MQFGHAVFQAVVQKYGALVFFPQRNNLRARFGTNDICELVRKYRNDIKLGRVLIFQNIPELPRLFCFRLDYRVGPEKFF
jgi:hypothetical protein